MFSTHLPTILLGFSTLLSMPSLTLSAALASCPSCPSTITEFGTTYKLTLSREEAGNILQCNYDNPPISGFSPYCVYQNPAGQLIFSNVACPSQAPLIHC
ncbi:hypothetical protein D9613_008252 [Agrocybe pediades]|uniref:Uncharacterized protein n=1 Tax=Agrocybe pediades TaxID=84607 RepID=A0A8H4VP39_9AGAR|nr:hypothetical protein D9613_008252 [Agrocybe pediades]